MSANSQIPGNIRIPGKAVRIPSNKVLQGRGISTNAIPSISHKVSSTIDIKWHYRQWQAFQTNATELLFGGASEGGKSAFVRLSTSVWSGCIVNLNTYIYRKYYNDVITNHQDGPLSYSIILKPWINDKIVKVTEDNIYFERTNANISLRQMRTNEDLEKNQGIEKHVLVLDEATQIKQKFIKELRAWCRMPVEMKELLPQQIGHLYPKVIDKSLLKDYFPRIIDTANPIGESVGYFRRQFVMAREAFVVERAPDKEGGFLRQYIPSRIDDNPSADKEAQRRRLAGLGEARSQALIKGVWDAPTGDYFKEYDDDVHGVCDFDPEKCEGGAGLGWFTFATFDWGTHEPFAIYFWCVSSGDEFTDELGRKRWFPRGSLIAYKEWYGCNPEEPEKGVGMRNEEVARGILAMSPSDWSKIIITDSLPFQDRGMEKNGKKYTVADVFADNGCVLTRGNTSRIHGWSQMRDRLIGIPDGNGNKIPLIYFTHSCTYMREYIPALPYHDTREEDAAESGESTHACDNARLACTARPITQEKRKPLPEKTASNIIQVSSILSKINEPARRKRLY